METVAVTLQRNRCIGCGYCVDVAGEYFSMDRSDGKCMLADAVEKKGFFTFRTTDPLSYAPCKQAEQGCPTHAIRVAGR